MTRPSNFERDLAIVEKIDKEGWTFRKTCQFFNMSVSSIHKAYERGVKMKEGTKIKLSTVSVR